MDDPIQAQLDELIRKRENFIETLKETAEIAEASGQGVAFGILHALIGSMYAVLEVKLLRHIVPFVEQELVLLDAKKSAPKFLN